MAPDDPLTVVALQELLAGLQELLDDVEAPDPQRLLLERPDEALGAAVAPGLAHFGA